MTQFSRSMDPNKFTSAYRKADAKRRRHIRKERERLVFTKTKVGRRLERQFDELA